ncbi:hypothetical protein AVANS14531_08610 [Campylobacter sp. Cr9]|uniref:hypothetical protein n=1 Tax=Campylobacter sp. Cr9 TaxID=2735728 RepID=UPI003014972D|nr:hypothetical protein [Campylobacter sp. Cr9]
MYEAEFNKIKNKLPNAFMLYGSCRLSIFLNLEIIKSADKSDERLILRDSDYKLEKAINFLGESSLFSNSKLLILEFEKGISNKDLKEILKCINSENRLILAIYETKALKDLELVMNNNFVRFFDKKTSFEQISLLQDVANFYNIKTNEIALQYLQKNYEFDIFKAGCELLKYQNQILDINTLKEHCEVDNALGFDDFLTNFLNTKEPKEYIYKIIENEDEIALINKLYSSLLRLFTISSNLKINGRIDYKVAFGYTPPRQVCVELENQARKLSKFYEEIFAILLDTEYEIKLDSNNSSKEIMYSNLLKIYFLINS